MNSDRMPSEVVQLILDTLLALTEEDEDGRILHAETAATEVAGLRRAIKEIRALGQSRGWVPQITPAD